MIQQAAYCWLHVCFVPK